MTLNSAIFRPLDVADGVEMRTFYDTMCAAEAVGRPWFEAPPFDRCVTIYRSEDPASERHADVLEMAGQIVAVASTLCRLTDNTDLANVALFVAPEHQNCGYGSLLMDHLAVKFKALGRTKLVGQTSFAFADEHTHPVLGWWAKNDFHPILTAHRRFLTLPVTQNRIDQLWQEVQPHCADYQIEVLVGQVPEALLASYCAVTNQITVDAPTGGDDFEALNETPESVSARTQMWAERGERCYFAVATKADQVVGVSDLAVLPGVSEAEQGNTIVLKEHRGHRLGLALKLKMLEVLQDQHPEVVRVETENAAENTAMIAVNDQLGFVAEAIDITVRRDL